MLTGGSLHFRGGTHDKFLLILEKRTEVQDLPGFSAWGLTSLLVLNTRAVALSDGSLGGGGTLAARIYRCTGLSSRLQR